MATKKKNPPKTTPGKAGETPNSAKTAAAPPAPASTKTQAARPAAVRVKEKLSALGKTKENKGRKTKGTRLF